MSRLRRRPILRRLRAPGLRRLGTGPRLHRPLRGPRLRPPRARRPPRQVRPRRSLLPPRLIRHPLRRGRRPRLRRHRRRLRLRRGAWFDALATACVHIVARRHRLPLALPEVAVAAAAGRDTRKVARTAVRVASHLDLPPPPEFDAVQALKRTIKSTPVFENLDDTTAKELIYQGRFLMHCARKWLLTTSRQPLPLVAAVASVVAEVNWVEAEIEEVAKQIYTNVATSKVRHKELAETLVRVARSLLPWGADANSKNIIQHAPLLIKFMEMKAKSEAKSKNSEQSKGFEFNLEEVLDEYLDPKEEDAEYFRLGHRDEASGVSGDEVAGLKLSAEFLSLAYERVLERLADIEESGELTKNQKKRRSGRGYEFEAWKHSWLGNRWDSLKNLTLEQVVQRDVGFDMMPPSYVAGLESRSRGVKIEAAKRWINKIMNPSSADVVHGQGQ